MAVRAGELARRLRPFATAWFKEPPSPCDGLKALSGRLVTTADLACQEFILRELLAEGLANCTLAAEEDTASTARFGGSPAGWRLFVDPIDGTTAYALGTPRLGQVCRAAGVPDATVSSVARRTDARGYGVVLGASRLDALPVGVCRLPELGLTFSTVGGRAFVSGRALRLADSEGPSYVVTNSGLLDASGSCPELERADIRHRGFGASHPRILALAHSGDCGAYAGRGVGFDGQVMLNVLQAAGWHVRTLAGGRFEGRVASARVDVVAAPSWSRLQRVRRALRAAPLRGWATFGGGSRSR